MPHILVLAAACGNCSEQCVCGIYCRICVMYMSTLSVFATSNLQLATSNLQRGNQFISFISNHSKTILAPGFVAQPYVAASFHYLWHFVERQHRRTQRVIVYADRSPFPLHFSSLRSSCRWNCSCNHNNIFAMVRPFGRVAT